MEDVRRKLLECEARHLLAQPLRFRQEYLKAPPVQGRRAALEAEIRRQFEAAKK